MTEIKDKIELAETSFLTPYANNAKKHPDEQVDKIAASIKEYGFVQPLVVDEDNTVIIGHGRLKAAKKLGLDQVPVIRVEHLSEAEVKALRLADNRVAESGWDDESLAVELEQLQDAGFDMDLTGFDEDEVSVLFDEQNNVEEDDFDAEAAADEIEEPETREGEVWKLGGHRLMCGDATREEHIELLMDGEKADMVFTDPPYGISFQSGHREDKFDELKNDDTILDIQPAMEQASSEDIHWYVWTGQQVYPEWRQQFCEEYKNTIIWVKNGRGMGDLKGDYAPQYEMCLFCQYGRRNLESKRDTNVWSIDRDDVNEYDHPTQKPVELPARAIKNSSSNGESVLDLFGGSGSTLIACEQTGRKCFMMELDPVYCDVIRQRWEELTGETAEKVVSVE